MTNDLLYIVSESRIIVMSMKNSLHGKENDECDQMIDHRGIRGGCFILVYKSMEYYFVMNHAWSISMRLTDYREPSVYI